MVVTREQADIWSLGCVLYEMLMLRHAFEAPSIGKLAEKIIQGRHDSNSRASPKCSATRKQSIEKSIEKC